MLQSVKMKDFMTEKPVTFKPSTDIYEALHHLLANRISGATVLNDANEVVGMVSEMDMLKAVEESAYYNQGSGSVGDYMTGNVKVIEQDMTIFDIAKLLRELKYRRMPVVQNGKFIGQISARSILQALKDSVLKHDDSEDHSAE